MKIIRAEHLGMCFGVRDAIALARREVSAQPLTVLGELVHNETVLDDLAGRGVRFVSEPVQAKTRAAMITAHGASDRARARAQSAGLALRDATCPLVHYAHEAVRGLVKEGWHPVIVGRRGHVEVRGLTEDLGEHDIVLNEADVMALKKRMRFGIAAQTTQPIARVRELVQLLQERFPDSEVRFVDTVCRPTKQRQSAAVELARRSDVVIVVGGANSNNTAELVRTCGRDCERVHHVRDAGDVDSAWLSGAGVVGLTAGTSTPDEMIDAVEARLRELAVQHSAKAA
ncbi:MAG: 4-hydroxy-3-methylbut-2-enyl diphosphate reductase [Verrucomicrobiales bacterium]|nr:4-hydroxy-3-methylbut-2-enyl diphosphate reductase [Verrucomicrobiales bacterium]